MSGDSRLKMRAELGEYIRRITTVPLPAAPNVPIIDYEVSAWAAACLPPPPFWLCWFDSPWSHLAVNFDFVVPFHKNISFF